MKILFAGTPKTSSIILKNLIDLGHDVIGVITQPDKKRGRRAIESPSPVSEIARSNDIKQYKPTNLNDLDFKNSNSKCPDDCLPLQDMSYERLEFLGDSILEMIVSSYLFERYPDQNEGFLSKL